MAIVIDAMGVVENKKRLPCEAFFVDTNILIYYKDPFSYSLESSTTSRANEETTEVIHYLKSKNHKRFSTISVAIEYYKYIQVGYYKTQTEKTEFDTSDFKQLRENDIGFFDGWDLQIGEFRKLFTKIFQLHVESQIKDDILSDFKGSQVDFGDHAIYKYICAAFPEKERCVFTNDADFYSYDTNLFLLTTNKKIISKAKEDNKLFII